MSKISPSPDLEAQPVASISMRSRGSHKSIIRVSATPTTITNNLSEEMQQVSKPQRQQKSKNLLPSLLILTGLSLIGLVTLLSTASQRVKASEAKSITSVSRNSWRAGSFPVENFQTYTSGFGYRRSALGGSGWEFHRGLDLAAPDGSYIRNWWNGQVVEVSDNTACGTSIAIQSGNWRHTYCHMKGHVEVTSSGRYFIDRTAGLLIWEGQQVPSGARIGRVGMSGRTTGPHLHWGLKYGSQYVDPALVLQAMYSGQTISSQSQQRD